MVAVCERHMKECLEALSDGSPSALMGYADFEIERDIFLEALRVKKNSTFGQRD